MCIRDRAVRARLQWQAKVQALTSQGRMQAWIVGGLPVLLLAVLDRLEPDSMALLWHTRQGWMVLCLLYTSCARVGGISIVAGPLPGNHGSGAASVCSGC